MVALESSCRRCQQYGLGLCATVPGWFRGSQLCMALQLMNLLLDGFLLENFVSLVNLSMVQMLQLAIQIGIWPPHLASLGLPSVSICNIVLVGWGVGASCSTVNVSLLQHWHSSSSGWTSTSLRSWGLQFRQFRFFWCIAVLKFSWKMREVLSCAWERSLYLLFGCWCIKTNKTVPMSVLLYLCGSVVMSLHWRNLTGRLSISDLRFISLNNSTLTTIGLDWSGINVISGEHWL